jgi:hypothetical protein
MTRKNLDGGRRCSYIDSLPSHVLRAREPVLAKTLSHLPDELLSALAHGLERHAGRLEAGRLYADHDGGGCAVGVMLRELSPADYRHGRVHFWIRRHRRRSVLNEEVDFERSLVTRLSHVEMCFDGTALACRDDAPEADLGAAANATGRWMAERCREELRTRCRDGHSEFFVPEEWQTPATPPRPSTRVRQMVGSDGTVRVLTIAAPRAPAEADPGPMQERLELALAA